MLGSFGLMTGEAVAIHALDGALSVVQLTLIRGLGGLALIVVAGRSLGRSVWQTDQLPLQLLRGGMTVASLWLIFFSVGHLPLPEATAVQYTRPIFLTALAAVVLREEIGARRWMATVVGLAGALLIIGPTFSSWQGACLVGVTGAAVNAAAMVATKVLERRDSPITVMAYLNLVSVVFSVPGAFQPWPVANAWPFALAIFVLGPASLYLGLLAIRAADMSVLAPYDYSRLLLAVAVALVAFDEVPNTTAFLGATIVAGTSIWVALSVKRSPAPEAG
jgi:drug/metabolite transporter (DMT)-like permease